VRLNPQHEIAAAVARCGDHLRACARKYPRAWRLLDMFRDRREELGGWPAWCFCPLSAAYAIVSEGFEDRVVPAPTGPASESLDIGRIAALGAWRVGQGVYWIDETVRDAVLDTPINGEIPVKVLLGLPEWCVYVALPGHEVEGRTIHGFFAHLEHDTHDGRTELRIEMDFADAGPFESLSPEILHLYPGETLAQGYDRMLAETRRQFARHRQLGEAYLDGERQVRETAAARLSPLLSVLLYLCSRTAEYRAGGEARPSRPVYAQPVKVKAGWRLFAPERAKVWYVGERLGDAIRRADDVAAGDRPGEHGGRAGPRPHVRRAHWHLYWLGSKDPASPLRHPELRWLPPIPVALAEDTAEARMKHDKPRPIRDLDGAVAEAARELDPRGDAPDA
jgi:hypothetical protein